MQRILTLAMLVASLAATDIVAQQPPANPNAPSNPAISPANPAPAPGAPAAGANSFTEAQARARIENHGFSNVTGLTLDNQGVWRGKAMKDNRSVDIALDYQGNVTQR